MKMRCFYFCVLLLLSFLVVGRAYAVKHTTVSAVYNVNGVCDQCKKRIETAAYIKGVRYAEWNVETHDLTLKYNSDKTSVDEILKSVAKAGHDSALFKATDEDYDKLPACCRYRSGIKMK